MMGGFNLIFFFSVKRSLSDSETIRQNIGQKSSCKQAKVLRCTKNKCPSLGHVGALPPWSPKC